MLFEQESEALKKSSWPKCDQLADALRQHGQSAVPALESALKSRTKHVRSASLRAINAIDPKKGKQLAEDMLSDGAYEVREAAAKILGVPTPG